MILLLLVLAALSIVILVLQKPEVSPSELDEEARNERILKDLKKQNPNSEVFQLDGGD